MNWFIRLMHRWNMIHHYRKVKGEVLYECIDCDKIADVDPFSMFDGPYVPFNWRKRDHQ